MGGELNYKHLGGNQYEVTYIMYRNCYNPNPTALFPNPAIIDIRNKEGSLVTQLSIPFPGSDTIPVDTTNPCRITPDDVCVEVALYRETVMLPIIDGGYHLFAQEYARNAAINNIKKPASTGSTFYTNIPDTSLAIVNSSPVFNNFPPTFICVNEPIDFDFSATDDDGDSLVYSLCVPYKGGSYTFPWSKAPFDSADYAPWTGNGPTIPNIDWKPPYNLNNVMGGVPIAIDSKTGFLTGIPNTLGLFVVGICVDEYRDGVKINTIIKDFQYSVIQCLAPDAEILATFGYIWDCSDTGITVTFPNNSTNATRYFWNFGDTTTLADTSTLENPSYSYADTGTYEVMLIVEKGYPCADTAYVDVLIYLDIYARFNFEATPCAGIDINFLDSSFTQDGSIISQWEWQFGDGTTSTRQNPKHAYTDSGTYEITLKVTSNEGCANTLVDSITIESSPQAFALAGADDSAICSGNTLVLGGSPTASGGLEPYTYEWIPSNGLSNDAVPNPIVTPIGDTTYQVTITDQNGCQGIDSVFVTFVPSPIADAGEDSISSCFGDSVNLGGSPSGSGGTAPLSYLWQPNITLSNSTATNPNALPLLEQVYTLTVRDVNKCSATDSIKVKPIALFNVDAGGDTTICNKDTAILGGSPTASGSAGFTYKWSNQLSINDSAIANPKATPSDTTTYIVEVKDVNDCIVRDTIMINVNSLPTANAGFDVVMCIGDSADLTGSGGISYAWSPSTFLSADNIPNPYSKPSITTDIDYELTVIDINNCSDIDSVSISVGTSISANSGPDVNLCLNDTAQLFVTGGNRYSWAPSTGLSDTSIPNPLAFPTDSMEYIILATSDTCTAHDTIRVFVNPLPTASTSQPDTICINASKQLGSISTGSGQYPPFEFRWIPASSLNDSSLANPIATPDSTTNYYVEVRDANNCLAIDSQLVFISDPIIINAQQDTSICQNETVEIGGVNIVTGGILPYNYQWTPSSTLNDAGISNPVSSPLASTDYVLQVTDELNCLAFDTVTINVSTLTAHAGDNIGGCKSKLITLGETPSASGGLGDISYLWFPNDNLDDSSLANPQLIVTKNETITLTTQDSIGCSSIDSVTISLSKLTVDAGPTHQICPGDIISIGGTPTADSGITPYTYIWSGSGLVFNQNPSNPNASPEISTIYTLEVIDSTGCSVTDSVLISVFEDPKVDAGEDKIIEKGESAQLSASSGQQSYLWTPNSSISNIDIQSPTVSPPETIMYLVEAISANGCISQDSVLVRVISIKLQVATTFTPNGDGINDHIFIVNQDLIQFNFKIFNRWGELVFETSTYGDGWDGTYKGKPADKDTYTYIVEGTAANGKEVKDAGNIVLQR